MYVFWSEFSDDPSIVQTHAPSPFFRAQFSAFTLYEMQVFGPLQPSYVMLTVQELETFYA